MSKVEVEWEPLPPEFTDKPAYGRVDPKVGLAVVRVVSPAHGQHLGCYPCCSSVEYYVDVIDGVVSVCEWHDEDCPALPEIRRQACHGVLEPGTYCADCGTYNPNGE